MRAVWTLARKDLLLLWRDKAGLFWVIGFPLLIALLFGAIFSSQGGSVSSMTVALVDEDNSEGSHAFIEELESGETLRLREMPLDSAQSAVRKGSISAYIRLKTGFGEVPFLFAQTDSSLIEVGMDPSRRVTAGFIEGMIMQAGFKSLQSQFVNNEGWRSNIRQEIARLDSDRTQSGKFGPLRTFLGTLDTFLGSWDTALFGGQNVMSEPKISRVSVLREGTTPKSSYEITFPAAILWALIGCTSTFAMLVVTERRRGTYMRLRIAPVSRSHILAGKGMACFLTSIVVSVLLLLFGSLVFGVRLDRPVFLLAAVFSGALCFTGLMMLISVIGKTEQAVGGAGMALLLIMAMTGGAMVPLFVMPKWMSAVSNFSPVKWGIVSLEGAIWRGFTAAEMVFPIAILLAIGLIAFGAGVAILARTDLR